MKKPFIALVFALCLAVSVFPQAQASAQAALNQITPKLIRSSLLGEVVNNWTFAEGELVEVDIYSKTRKPGSNQFIVLADISTSDVTNTNRYAGRIRLTYERSETGRLLFVKSENVSFARSGSDIPEVAAYQPKYETHERSLVAGTHHIRATGWTYWTFALKRPTRVSGRFVSEGGGVQGLIMNEDEFVNWRNGNSYRSYFDSGTVTIGNVEATLPAGSFTFVLYNANWFSGKTVSVSLMTR